MRRFLRAAVAAIAAFGLTVAVAPSAVAADPVITFTVSGASNVDVYVCPWSDAASTYTCGDAIHPTTSGVSLPMTSLEAGQKYAIKVGKSGFWTLWWHQDGISIVQPTTTAAGEYISAGSSSIALGTFVMTRRYQLSGLVTSETSTRLGGIEVGIYADLAAVAAGTPLTGITTSGDGDGKDLGTYDIVIPYAASGSYVVGLKDPSAAYAQTTEVVTLAAAATTHNFALKVNDHMVTVSGTVALGDETTPAEVSVDAFVWNSDTSSWAPTTSEESTDDGSYRLSIQEGRTFTLRFSKPGYRTTWLGGPAPAEPTDTNSRVASSLTNIDPVTLGLWSSAFGTVAGQKLDGDVCTQNTLASASPEALDLGFSVGFHGKTGSRLYVTDKGFVYLSDTAVPELDNLVQVDDLAKWTGVPIVAPLWFDGDLSGPTADSVSYGSDDSTACIRWNDVGHSTGDDSAPNTFQLIITSRSGELGRSVGDVDLTFNYDQVLWDAVGQARVGYTAGDKVETHRWVNADAASAPGTILDGGTSPLIAGSVGSSTPGRYHFEIHNALVPATAPSIVGTPLVGTTLSANPGQWSPTPDSLSYQWFLAGKQVSTATKYKVPSKSEGKLITLTVTAKKAGLNTVSATAPAKPVLRKFSKSSTPKISGTVKVGSTLTAKPGSWSPKASFGYQWYRGGSPISGATRSKYKVQLADVGAKLSVRVTGSRSGYLGITKGSKSTKTVPLASMSAATPKISGSAKIGQTLTVSTGTWTAGVSFRYQWYRSGKTISGATNGSYLLQATDKGKTITVKVTGSLAGYQTTSKTSKATSKVS